MTAVSFLWLPEQAGLRTDLKLQAACPCFAPVVLAGSNCLLQHRDPPDCQTAGQEMSSEVESAA